MRRVCRIHFCIGEYMFCIGGMLEKNYLKFSQIFTFFHFFLQIFAKNFRGARCGRSVGYIFSIGNFGGKKLSQIFSNFLGIHFYVLAMAENYLKFSQIFTFFHFFLQIFAKKFKDARCGRSVGYIFSIGNFGTKYLPQMMGSRSGGGYR